MHDRERDRDRTLTYAAYDRAIRDSSFSFRATLERDSERERIVQIGPKVSLLFLESFLHTETSLENLGLVKIEGATNKRGNSLPLRRARSFAGYCPATVTRNKTQISHLDHWRWVEDDSPRPSLVSLWAGVLAARSAGLLHFPEGSFLLGRAFY